MNKKRFYGNLIYALSMTLIIIMRILVSAGVFSGLSDMESDLVWSGAVQLIILGLIPFFLYAVYLKKSGEKRPVKAMLNNFGYTRSPSAKGWIIVIIISIISSYLVTCVSTAWYNFITMIGYIPKISTDTPYTPGTLFISLLTTAVLPPLFEEFSNRGVLYHTYDEGKSPFRVVLITAVMFALMHTNITQVLYTFVFGMVAAALVYTTKSIWPAVFYHFINNFISVMNSYGYANGNGLNFLNKVYDVLFSSALGVTVASLLFIIGAVFLSWLIFELSSIETIHREKKGICAENVRCDGDKVEVCGKYDNLPLYFAVILNVVATVFTLVWGIIR